jgi:nitroimidazol reductase NimA-like FMN-containing flavoprotein (pyridoxamine 5'-phosphate oxidase superfamily)
MMRRKDKEITDRDDISQVIRKCQVCRIGLAMNNKPYIVPVSFGYDGSSIFFHSSGQGKKIEYIATNNEVCFEFEHGAKLVPHEEKPCDWSFSFQSVIGYGRVEELVSHEDKTEGLNQIMKQYSGQVWTFGEEALNSLRVWEIHIESMTGKQSKDMMAA